MLATRSLQLTRVLTVPQLRLSRTALVAPAARALATNQVAVKTTPRCRFGRSSIFSGTLCQVDHMLRTTLRPVAYVWPLLTVPAATMSRDDETREPSQHARDGKFSLAGHELEGVSIAGQAR